VNDDAAPDLDPPAAPLAAALEQLFPRATERLSLRPFRSTDVPAVLAYRGRADVCRFIEAEPLTPESAIDFVDERLASTQTTGERTTTLLAVTVEGELAGDVMLRFGPAIHRQAEIGWVFNPGYGGRGYATEAARCVASLAFSELNAHRVWADLDSRNAASAKVCLRLGMRHEARLREESFVKGGWADRSIYGILESEWPVA